LRADPGPSPIATVYCLDAGQTTWKVATARIQESAAVLGAVRRGPSGKPYFSCKNGHSRFISDLVEPARILTGRESLEGIAGAVPFRIDYGTGRLDSEGRAGWPERLDQLETSFRRALGVERIVVLNDAVAYALGHRQQNPSTDVAPSTLYLTLGTFVGAVWSPAHASVLHPIEVRLLLPQQWWPNGTRQSPSAMLSELPFLGREASSWMTEEAADYSHRIGWVVGAMLATLPAERVVFGGGRSYRLDLSALMQGVSELGAKIPQCIVAPQDELALLGAAAAWAHRYIRELPLSSLIGTGLT
jgi:hypothetical protein